MTTDLHQNKWTSIWDSGTKPPMCSYIYTSGSRNSCGSSHQKTTWWLGAETSNRTRSLSRGISNLVSVHRCVMAKSGQIVVLLKIFVNKGTSDYFVNLSPILTIFRILVNNGRVHLSHDGCHGNHFGGNVCYHRYQIITLCDKSLESWHCQHSHEVCGIVICCTQL